MPVEKLNVYLRLTEEEQLVGQLVLDDRDILFKYSDDYLANGFSLSPLKLRFNNEIQTGPTHPFKGLYGVFADSLPDAWGQLLLQRQLSQQDIGIETLNSLDRLAYIGSNGSGALIYRPTTITEEEIPREVELDLLADQATQILEGNSAEVVDEMFGQGGSPGGARPKIYAGYNPQTDSLLTGINDLPEGYEHWILKFAATVDSSDIANIEKSYYLMALEAGITMSPCRLFVGASGKKYFGTKRFDRDGSNRIHMLSAAGLLHDDYERSQLDYGTLMHVGAELAGSAEVHQQVLRLAAFNIFAHNRDDHSKNFAFLADTDGQWKFAPAYDLTFSSSSQGEHSTRCAGNGKDPGTKELTSLIDHFSISKGKDIVDHVRSTVARWDEFAEIAEVTDRSKRVIRASIQQQLTQ